MQQIDGFEKRLKQTVELMSKGSTKSALFLLKQLEKDIRLYFEENKIEEDDRLSQIQIAIYNNLACIFEKKGKYKSSLYHLQLAEKLENNYFSHKYNDGVIPAPALQKLATTYSNLSAIQSKLGNSREALVNIEFAIEVMKKNENFKNHQNFIFLYYNYSVLLEGASRFNQASKHALDGLQIARSVGQEIMISKYEDLLKRLKIHLVRQQIRRQKEIRKYVRGEIGIVRKIQGFNQTVLSKQSKQQSVTKPQINNFLYQTITKNKDNTISEKASFTVHRAQRSSYYRPRNYTQISNRQTKQSQSLGVLQQSKYGKIKSNKIMNNKSSNPIISSDYMNKTATGIVEAYGIKYDKKKRQFSTLNRDVIGNRMRQRKNKLQFEIGELGHKNEVLQKIIEKLYLGQKKDRG